MHSGSLWLCAVLACDSGSLLGKDPCLYPAVPHRTLSFLSLVVLTKTLSVRPASKIRNDQFEVLFELESGENCNKGRASKLFPCSSPRMFVQAAKLESTEGTSTSTKTPWRRKMRKWRKPLWKTPHRSQMLLPKWIYIYCT